MKARGYGIGKSLRNGGRAAALGMAIGLGAAVAPSRGADSVGPHWSEFVQAHGLDPSLHPQHLGNVAAWNKGDSIFVMAFDVQCLLSVCGDCVSMKHRPLGIKVPDADPRETPPFALVKAASTAPSEGFSAIAILIRADGTLLRLRAESNGSDAMGSGWETGASTLAGKEGIANLAFPAADFTTASDSAAVVLGTNGLGFRLEWTKDGIKETKLGLPRYDFTARGGRYLGTSTGEILRFAPFPKLERIAQPWAARIVALDSAGGVDAAGHFFYSKAGDSWAVAPEPAPDGTRAWKTSFDPLGMQALVWGSDTSGPRVLRLPDWRTHGIVPPEYRLLFSSGELQAPDDYSVRVPIDITDEDGDFEAPVIRILRGRDTIVISQELRATIPGFGVANNGTRYSGCADSGVCLNGTRVRAAVELIQGSLRVAMPVMRGRVVRACANPQYFQGGIDYSYALEARLASNDHIQMIFGTDTVRAFSGTGTAIRAAHTTLSRRSGAPAARPDGRMLPSGRLARVPAFGRP